MRPEKIPELSSGQAITSPDPNSQLPTPASQLPILSVRDLRVEYRTAAGRLVAVDQATFDLHPGESIALIGESGSGKTTMGLGLLRLLPKAAHIPTGEIQYRRRDGRVVDILGLSRDELR